MRTILRFLRRERGATAVEYAVMLATIVTVVIATVEYLGIQSQATFSNAADMLGAIAGP